jgi:hypothetical protein
MDRGFQPLKSRRSFDPTLNSDIETFLISKDPRPPKISAVATQNARQKIKAVQEAHAAV